MSSPEPDDVLSGGALRSLINERTGPVSYDLKQPALVEEVGPTHRRWGIAIASAAAVVVAGLFVVLVGFGTAPEDVVEPAADPSIHPAMVTSFIASWNSGHHAEATAVMAPNLTINGEPWTVAEWQNYMEYTQAIGMTLEASCAQAVLNVSCDVSQVGPFVDSAPEGPSGKMAFSIVDDQILGLVMPRLNTAEDRLAGFARATSRTEYAAECAAVEGSHWHGLYDTTPITFNARCGTFVATHTAAFVAAEADVRTVGAYFDAWNAADISAAELLLADDLSVNNTEAEENWTNFMQFAVAFDGSHDVACEPTPRGAICSWVWNTTFVDAQATGNAGGSNIRFTVEDGLITSFRTPSYGAFEAPLAAFVRATDRDGLDVACATDGVSIVGSTGLVFNATCGSFLASHVDAFVAELED
ncbi:MAG: hypothetical protein ACR2N9_02380 [Acidimicrobiia bacterium]